MTVAEMVFERYGYSSPEFIKLDVGVEADGNVDPRKAVERTLQAAGFDGLFAPDACGECACKIGDLMPCENNETELLCEPGYLEECDPETCRMGMGGGCDFHIVSEKGVT